jgi:dipeptidyl aminopeptidase/acylaminoacyl peptidase
MVGLSEVNMKFICTVFIACAIATPNFAAVSGPNDRQPTDPKSVHAKSNIVAQHVEVEDLFGTRIIDTAALSPDGKEIALATNLSGRTNLWTTSSNGSWPVQLVRSDDRQADLSWSPDGRWIAFTQDKGGNELWDIYVIPRGGGTPTNLTNTADIREQHPLWSHDGKSVVCIYKPKAAPSYDVAIIDVASHKLRKLTEEKDQQMSWDVVGFSPDNKTVYANRANSSGDQGDLYSIDAATGAATNLTTHQGKRVVAGSDVSSDGKTVLVSNNEKGGFTNVALLDVSSKKMTWVTDTQWEVQPGAFSTDGKRFTYLVNADGRSTLYLGETANGKSVAIDLPAGINSVPSVQHFSRDGRYLLVAHEAMNTPADLWLYDTPTKQARQVTHTAIAGLGPESIPPSDLVHYKSYDGKIISAFLRLPFNVKPDGSNPAIIFPHGGPTGQTTDGWTRWSNALAAHGYIVLMPNPRGSSGYGIEFQRANYQDLGGGDLKDEMAGLDWLMQTGYVDPNKVGVFGGSYGGYMTLMLAAKESQRFKAAVDLFGPLDWYSMMKNSDPSLQQYIVGLLGDPEKDRKVYEDTSPIKYVEQIKAPMLVLQGENDPRVPKEETEQVVSILKKRGNVIEVFYYPDEGHGFDKVEHQIDAGRRTVDWFDKYLKGTATH